MFIKIQDAHYAVDLIAIIKFHPGTPPGTSPVIYEKADVKFKTGENLEVTDIDDVYELKNLIGPRIRY